MSSVFQTDTQMRSNRYVKRHTTMLFIRELQVKLNKILSIPVIMVIVKILELRSDYKNVEKK